MKDTRPCHLRDQVCLNEGERGRKEGRRGLKKTWREDKREVFVLQAGLLG